MGHGRGQKIRKATTLISGWKRDTEAKRKAREERDAKYEAERKAAHDNWMTDPNPLCPGCNFPKADIKERPNCFDIEIYGIEDATMISCLDCWNENRLDI
jgi:hypothetical protein